MSVSLRQMTPCEFVAWEDAQPAKHEFDGYAIVAMTGSSVAHSAIQSNVAHSTIQSNIVIAVSIRLRGTHCRVHGSELKIEVAGSVRYPDALVVCTPAEPRQTMANEPVVVFEVLSPSSMRTDRIDKLREYQQTPSIQRYVMFEQDITMATVFSREKSEWVARVRYDTDTLDMPEIGISVPMSEFYLDVEFAPAPESKSPPSEEGGETLR